VLYLPVPISRYKRRKLAQLLLLEARSYSFGSLNLLRCFIPFPFAYYVSNLLLLRIIFFWSREIVTVGLQVPGRKHLHKSPGYIAETYMIGAASEVRQKPVGTSSRYLYNFILY